MRTVMELPDRSIIAIGNEFVPRKGEHIFWDGSRYEIMQVQYHSGQTHPNFTQIVEIRLIVAQVR